MRSDDPRGERGQSTTKKEIKKVQKAVKDAAKEDRTAQAYVDRWDEGIRSTKAAEEFKPSHTLLEDLQAAQGAMGTSTALSGFALKKAFLNQRGKKCDAGYVKLADWKKSLSKKERQRVNAADRAGLFGGGVMGDIEAFQKGTDQSEYQAMMNTMRTGELGPAMQEWYQDKFPKTYGFMRGSDTLHKGLPSITALKSMFGTKKEKLPYDDRRDWYDELNRIPINPYGERTIITNSPYETPSLLENLMHLTPYQEYKLQSQMQERGGFTGGNTYEDKIRYAKQMGILPKDFQEDQSIQYTDWTDPSTAYLPQLFDFSVGSEQAQGGFYDDYTPEEIAKLSMHKQPTKSEWHEYLTGRPEWQVGNPVFDGIIKDEQTRDLYEEAIKNYQMGADPVTGGARMELDEPTQQITYSPGGGGGGTTPPPDDEDDTPPGDENQWAPADQGQVGWMDEFGDYNWGPYADYKDYAQVNPIFSKDGGIIGLDGGGYINDYQAADSLMFKDPQENEEWEYNV